MSGLPKVFTASDLADALDQTEHYVTRQARTGKWPHIRVARGAIRFTQEDVDAVLELCRRRPADKTTSFLTPASQRSVTRRRTGSQK